MSEESTPNEGQAKTREESLGAVWDKLNKENEEQEAAQASEETVTAEEEVVEPQTEDVEQVESSASQEASEEEVDYNEPAPERWPSEMKEDYNNLPPAGKKLMMKVYKPMQASYTKSTQQLAEQRKQVEALDSIRQEMSDDFVRLGIDPIEAIRQQAAWARHLQKVGPEQWASDIVEAYGAKPTAQTGQQDSSEYLTPEERRLQGEVSEIRETLSSLQQQQQQAAEQSSQAKLEEQVIAARRSLAEFISAEVDGKPVNPQAQELLPQMAQFLDSNMVRKVDEYGQQVPFADQIKQAYEMAGAISGKRPMATPPANGKVSQAKAANQIAVATEPSSSKAPVRPLNREDRIAADYDRLQRQMARR